MKICQVEGETGETGLIDPEYNLKMDKYLSSLDMKDSRYSILSYPQVKRLSNLMNETIPIHGRGNFPTLEVKLVGLVVLVKSKLEAAGIPVKDIRLNGSVASSVLAVESNIEYNDMDLIFSVELNSQRQYEKVKQVVLDSLLDLLPEGTSKERMSGATLKEAYVSKMVKVTETDRWSLIALGNNRTKSVELKFVDEMKRKYEFSVDSFHIILDTLFLFYECSKMSMSENFYPTVVGESVYGDFSEALYHLENRLIATKHPEQIRGGGLLKYCNLLVKNYRPAAPEQVKNMERYMCSRFFIDFPDLAQQRSKLIKFLDNHFLGNDDQLKYDYLTILYQVVNESTVCLMGHERRLTLALIEALSCNVFLPYGGADPATTQISNSNWCNSASCGTLNQISNCGSGSSGSCHSSRSSPAPSYSSPGSSSSYPSPAPSNTPSSSFASPSPASSTNNINNNNNNQSYATTPTHHPSPSSSSSSSSSAGGHYSPMSAASVSPQSMSPKPAGCISSSEQSTEWRMVPISWVTISPAGVAGAPPPPPSQQQPPPPPPPHHTTTKVTVETCSGGQTTNHSVTYHQVPVRSITATAPPSAAVAVQQSSGTSSGSAPQHAITAPPPPVTIVTTSAPPPPLSSNSMVMAGQAAAGDGCVPRYEIITTCQPAQVLYSTNGNYYTAFLKPGSSEAASGQPCYTCSCTCQASIQWTIAPNHQAT